MRMLDGDKVLHKYEKIIPIWDKTKRETIRQFVCQDLRYKADEREKEWGGERARGKEREWGG